MAHHIFSERPTFSAVDPIDKLITYGEILNRSHYQPKTSAARIQETQVPTYTGQINKREK